VTSFVFNNFLASFPRFCASFGSVIPSGARNPALPGCLAEKSARARFLPFAALRVGMTGLGEFPREPLLGSNPLIWRSKLGSFWVRFCTLQKLTSFVFNHFLASFPRFLYFVVFLGLPLPRQGRKIVAGGNAPGNGGEKSQPTLKGSHKLRFWRPQSRRGFIRPFQGRRHAPSARFFRGRCPRLLYDSPSGVSSASVVGAVREPPLPLLCWTQ